MSKMLEKGIPCVYLFLLTFVTARPGTDFNHHPDIGISHRIFDVIDAPQECNGSVTLFEGTEENVMTEDGDIERLDVEKAVVEGCGCFRLHAKKKGKGKSVFLSGGEKTFQNKMKVRSVKKVDCDRYADV